MAKLGSLYAKIVARGEQLFRDALAETRYELDRRVPDSSKPSIPKLRASREITNRPFDGEVFSATITYTAPQAVYTEYGTEPHVIVPRGPYPLRFYWPKVGRVVYFWKVNHPGSHKHDGWFSKTVAQWSSFLDAVTQRPPDNNEFVT